MSELKISAGVSGANCLPQGQLLILGKHKCIKELAYEVVAPKFCDENGGCAVTEESFNKALGLISKGAVSAVPLYFNTAQIITVGDETSRHNAPSNCISIGKAVKSLSQASANLSVVLVCEYGDVLASTCAVARCFPLFNRKTKITLWNSVSIEVVLTDSKQKVLTTEELEVLRAVTDSIRLAARLVDMPCSELDTVGLADEAVKVANSLPNVNKLVIKGEELKERGFGGLYSVGKAAVNPSIFVCLSYTPDGASETYALVGKGIVFDTGGMQIKTKTTMPGMKVDMGGAAAVLGSFAALVRADFKQNLHCLLCIAENNISPVATKPDDIITMLSGKTVEINNTDAEGRLVLGDGVYFAQNQLKANVIIDMATLTSAQTYATGQTHAAVMTNKERWERAAVEAGRYSGDLAHPLPYCPDLFFPDLASQVADMKNSNLGKMQGPPSCIAGLFIGAQMNFSNDVDWVHVDMCGPAHGADRATGYGPALVLTLLGRHTDHKILHFPN